MVSCCAFDHLCHGDQPRSIVACVVLLQSLIIDQHKRFIEHGLSVEIVSGVHNNTEVVDKLNKGLAQIILISPEALLTNLQWRDMLRSQASPIST